MGPEPKSRMQAPLQDQVGQESIELASMGPEPKSRMQGTMAQAMKQRRTRLQWGLNRSPGCRGSGFILVVASASFNGA